MSVAPRDHGAACAGARSAAGATKEIHMYNAGLSPERTPDPRRAFHLWSSDGAVILTTNRADANGMLASARDVFGPRILVHQSPTIVADDTVPGQNSYYAAMTRTVNGDASVALDLHIDGYLPFGDHYPDLVFLLCQHQAAGGGESFIVDGQRLVDAITSNPAQ